jgi:hypothetical protein
MLQGRGEAAFGIALSVQPKDKTRIVPQRLINGLASLVGRSGQAVQTEPTNQHLQRDSSDSTPATEENGPKHKMEKAPLH